MGGNITDTRLSRVPCPWSSMAGVVVRVVGVSARCWVLREQAPSSRPPRSPLTWRGGGGVVAGVVVSVAVGMPVRVSARVGAGVCRGRGVSWWPWGVCELDSGCEHLDLNDLLMSDLADPSVWVCLFLVWFLL